MLFDGLNLNLFIAFIAGIVAFFSPCVAPIIPAYLSYASGLSVAEKEHRNPFRSTAFRHGLWFVLGFVLVFIILGFSVSAIGKVFLDVRPIIQRIGGVLLILLGIHLLELIKIPWLYRSLQFNLNEKVTKPGAVSSFLVGSTFGFAWTPCIGPVLAVILFWASQADTAIKGAYLLLAFGLGIALPFLLMSLAVARAVQWVRRHAKWLRRIQLASGGVLVLVGILMLTGQFSYLTGILARITPVI